MSKCMTLNLFTYRVPNRSAILFLYLSKVEPCVRDFWLRIFPFSLFGNAFGIQINLSDISMVLLLPPFSGQLTLSLFALKSKYYEKNRYDQIIFLFPVLERLNYI